MKRALTLLTAALLAIPAVAAEPAAGRETMRTFTWGARAGFAANSTYITKAVIDGHEIEDYRQDTQLGNFAAMQFRFNARRLFLQTGIGLSRNKSTFYIDRNSWNPLAESVNEMGLCYSMTSLTVPIQAGCHIVNNTPYCLSVSTGPTFRLPFKTKYSTEFIGIQEALEETAPDLIVGWALGLGIQIGRSFFDFEYECGINNISSGIRSDADGIPDPDITLDRRMTILSFSFGIMF